MEYLQQHAAQSFFCPIRTNNELCVLKCAPQFFRIAAQGTVPYIRKIVLKEALSQPAVAADLAKRGDAKAKETAVVSSVEAFEAVDTTGVRFRDYAAQVESKAYAELAAAAVDVLLLLPRLLVARGRDQPRLARRGFPCKTLGRAQCRRET